MLKFEAVRSSKTSTNSYQSTRRIFFIVTAVRTSNEERYRAGYFRRNI
jgi:hypothetical protein